jgi:hypothetical protein
MIGSVPCPPAVRGWDQVAYGREAPKSCSCPGKARSRDIRTAPRFLEVVSLVIVSPVVLAVVLAGTRVTKAPFGLERRPAVRALNCVSFPTSGPGPRKPAVCLLAGISDDTSGIPTKLIPSTLLQKDHAKPRCGEPVHRQAAQSFRQYVLGHE